MNKEWRKILKTFIILHIAVCLCQEEKSYSYLEVILSKDEELATFEDAIQRCSEENTFLATIPAIEVFDLITYQMQSLPRE